MYRTLIAIVDASRARLFTYDRADEIGGLREAFSERTDLVNPARRRTPAQLFSDTRTSSSRVGGRAYGVNDHRDAHVDNIDAEFAREVATAIATAVRDAHAKRVVVCASPRMLGFLRTTQLRHDGVEIAELARDYAKHTPPQIHDLLVEHGLLPAPESARLGQTS